MCLKCDVILTVYLIPIQLPEEKKKPLVRAIENAVDCIYVNSDSSHFCFNETFDCLVGHGGSAVG